MWMLTIFELPFRVKKNNSINYCMWDGNLFFSQLLQILSNPFINAEWSSFLQHLQRSLKQSRPILWLHSLHVQMLSEKSIFLWWLSTVIMII